MIERFVRNIKNWHKSIDFFIKSFSFHFSNIPFSLWFSCCLLVDCLFWFMWAGGFLDLEFMRVSLPLLWKYLWLFRLIWLSIPYRWDSFTYRTHWFSTVELLFDLIDRTCFPRGKTQHLFRHTFRLNSSKTWQCFRMKYCR